MVPLVLAVIAGFIPCLALFFWLRNALKKEETYQKLCTNALIKGMLCTLWIFLASGVPSTLLRLTGLHNSNRLLFLAIHEMIVIALAEELVKYFTARKLLKKTDYPCSWLDVTVVMTIAAIGFSIPESLLYTIGASVPIVLVRGICVPHAGYGFIEGFFYGKALKTGKGFYKVLGIFLAWLLHALYDFCLSQEVLALNDNIAFIPVTLALVDIVLVIVLIVFAVKAKKREVYTEPLSCANDA